MSPFTVFYKRQIKQLDDRIIGIKLDLDHIDRHLIDCDVDERQRLIQLRDSLKAERARAVDEKLHYLNAIEKDTRA